jgi:hypothetical protein
MEVFVDFGLFELLAAAGLAFVTRKIYLRRWPGLTCLLLSLTAPAAMVFMAHEGIARWIAVACLATALVNGSLIFMLMRRWGIATLLVDEPASPAVLEFDQAKAPTETAD